jgi:hypothetical protein
LSPFSCTPAINGEARQNPETCQFAFILAGLRPTRALMGLNSADASQLESPRARTFLERLGSCPHHAKADAISRIGSGPTRTARCTSRDGSGSRPAALWPCWSSSRAGA